MSSADEGVSRQRLACEQSAACATLRDSTNISGSINTPVAWRITITTRLFTSCFGSERIVIWEINRGFRFQVGMSPQLSRCGPDGSCAVTVSRGPQGATPACTALPISRSKLKQHPLLTTKHCSFPICLPFCLILQAFPWSRQRQDLKLSFSLFCGLHTGRTEVLTLLN